MINPYINRIVNRVRRIPCVSLGLFLAAVGIQFYHPLRLRLIFDRNAIANGDIIRIVFCHVVHLNFNHLLWSGLTFLGLGSLCEIIDPRRYVMTLSLSILLIPIAIFIFMPNLDIYGGLSGLDCALYVLLITNLLNRDITSKNRGWQVIYLLMLLLLILKASFEIITGNHLFVSHIHREMTTVPLAHLTGGLIGMVVAFLYPKSDKIKQSTKWVLNCSLKDPDCLQRQLNSLSTLHSDEIDLRETRVS